MGPACASPRSWRSSAATSTARLASSTFVTAKAIVRALSCFRIACSGACANIGASPDRKDRSCFRGKVPAGRLQPRRSCFADGNGYFRALIAKGLLVPGQVAHQSRLIDPIEVLTTQTTSPNHRPASRMGHKTIPLCPWGNNRSHLSNPRFRSTRRLIRPLDPPPDRQSFYSRDRINRLLVGRPSRAKLRNKANKRAEWNAKKGEVHQRRDVRGENPSLFRGDRRAFAELARPEQV